MKQSDDEPPLNLSHVPWEAIMRMHLGGNYQGKQVNQMLEQKSQHC